MKAPDCLRSNSRRLANILDSPLILQEMRRHEDCHAGDGSWVAAVEVGDDVRGSGAQCGCKGFAFVRELKVGAEVGQEGERGGLGFGGSRGGGGRGGDGACLLGC